VSAVLPASGRDLLTIDCREEGGGLTLRVCGEIDLASAPLLRQALKDAEQSSSCRIVLDLGALDFIDSSGILVLIEAQRRAASNAHALALRSVPPHAHRLFRLMGVEALLPIE
jgi:anti-sigma B factor antagonist